MMNSKRMFFVLLGVIGLLVIAAIAILVFGNNKLQEQSDKLNELRIERRTLEEQQTSLARAQADIETYSELEEIAKTVVPQDKDQARAVREIITMAEESGIAIQSINFPASELGSGSGSRGDSGSDSSVLTQATPVDGIDGVYSLEMRVNPDSNTPITYNQLIRFLERLENNRRTSSVSRVRIDPDREQDQETSFVNFQLTLNIYLKPE